MEGTAKMLTSRSEVGSRIKTQKNVILCTDYQKSLKKTKARFHGPFSFYNHSKHAGAKLRRMISAANVSK